MLPWLAVAPAMSTEMGWLVELLRLIATDAEQLPLPSNFENSGRPDRPEFRPLKVSATDRAGY